MKRQIARKGDAIRLPNSIRKLFPKVEFAYEAEKPVEVSVDAKDCKTAEPLNPAECALARAAKRELKADGVIIGLSSSYLIKGNIAIRFATPSSVQREIVSFDRHSDFAPGDYYLTPKSPSQRLGSRKGTKSGSRVSKRKFHKVARVRVLGKAK